MEALTLEHEKGSFEVACNLRDCRVQGPSEVLRTAAAIANQLGIEIAHSYTTGPTEEELVEIFSRKFTGLQGTVISNF